MLGNRVIFKCLLIAVLLAGFISCASLPSAASDVVLSGRVLYAGGDLAPGATVYIDYGGSSYTTTCNGAGEYYITVPYAGDSAIFRASLGDAGSTEYTVGITENGATYDVVLNQVTVTISPVTLPPEPTATPSPTPVPTAAFVGHVYAGDAPASGALVVFSYGGNSWEMTTDETGYYGFGAWYGSGDATIRVYYMGVYQEYDVTPAPDSTNERDLYFTAPTSGNSWVVQGFTFVDGAVTSGVKVYVVPGNEAGLVYSNGDGYYSKDSTYSGGEVTIYANWGDRDSEHISFTPVAGITYTYDLHIGNAPGPTAVPGQSPGATPLPGTGFTPGVMASNRSNASKAVTPIPGTSQANRSSASPTHAVTPGAAGTGNQSNNTINADMIGGGGSSSIGALPCMAGVFIVLLVIVVLLLLFLRRRKKPADAAPPQTPK